MVGLDLDNTIICYDGVFADVAIEKGWLKSADLPDRSKNSVRAALRRVLNNDYWTELQGWVYGPHLLRAKPYPGVLEFFDACRALGERAVIISHKTQFPALGPQEDMRLAAMRWLGEYGFFAPATGLTSDDVFFAATKEEKIGRLTVAGCHSFVDDLPEILDHQEFPPRVVRCLFDPDGHFPAWTPPPAGLGMRVTSWKDVQERLLDFTSRSA